MMEQKIIIPPGRGYDVAQALKARAAGLAKLMQYQAAADLQAMANEIDEGA